MKTIIAVLFLCSVAVGQQAASPQSSKPSGNSMQWTVGSTHLQGLEVRCETDETDWAHVTKCNFGKHRPEEVINWMIDQNRERDTCGSKGVQWILGKDGKILYGRRTPECPTKKKRKAGAHSEPTGKPDSEKPEKKLP